MIRVAIGLLFAIALSAAQAALAAPPVEAYGKLPGIEEVQLSPSGERYAFVATDGENRRLYVATLDGKPLRVAEVSTTKVRGLEWAGEDHVLVTIGATVTLGPEFTVWQAELETVVVLNIQTGKVLQVFSNQKNRVVNSVFGQFGTAQVDGHWYGWFGGRTCVTDSSGCYSIVDYVEPYRVDLDTGAISLAAHGRKDSDEWLISGSGDIVARSFYNEKSGNWRILAGKEGDQVLAAGQNEFGGAGSLHFGRSADTVMVKVPTGATGEDRDAYEYREFSIAGAASAVAADMAHMNEPIVDPATHLWIGKMLGNDEQEMAFFPPAIEARWRGARKAFPNNIVHLESWSADFNRLVVFTEGGDDSGTYWLVDIAKRSAEPIGSQYPTVKSEDVGPVQMVDYQAADGLALHGVLTLPPGKPAKGLPLVVLPHGGPEARDYPSFDWWAQAFASRGYAVFQPNFRGSSGYGIEFRNAGLGEWGHKMQTDISDGVADLAKKGIVDPKRACIVGASYGGYAALAGVTVQQGFYRCAVSVAGVADLSGMLIHEHKVADGPSSATRYWRAFMGAASSSDSRLTPITPAALADRADAPILLIHGDKDTVVPIEQSETMESALRRAGKPVELVRMDNEDHWLSREETRIVMLKSAVAFVEKYNPPN